MNACEHGTMDFPIGDAEWIEPEPKWLYIVSCRRCGLTEEATTLDELRRVHAEKAAIQRKEAEATRERANQVRLAGLVPVLLFIALAALAILLAGCTTGRSHALEPRWRPLRSVEEASDKLLRPGLTTTISPRCYVPDLKAWLRSHPPGSVEYEAILLHEQVHAVRQEGSLGLAPWIGAYLLDPAFRWREEQAGYKVMLTRLVKAGRSVDAKALARSLADGYILLGAPMVAEAEALAWVESVLSEAQR